MGYNESTAILVFQSHLQQMVNQLAEHLRIFTLGLVPRIVLGVNHHFAITNFFHFEAQLLDGDVGGSGAVVESGSGGVVGSGSGGVVGSGGPSWCCRPASS